MICANSPRVCSATHIGACAYSTPLRKQESVSGNAQAGVVMKVAPAPAFIVAESQILLEILVVPLDAPAHLGLVRHALRRCFFAERGQPVFQWFSVARGPLDEQPLRLAQFIAEVVAVRRVALGRGDAGSTKSPARSSSRSALLHPPVCGPPRLSKNPKLRQTASASAERLACSLRASIARIASIEDGCVSVCLVWFCFSMAHDTGSRNNVQHFDRVRGSASVQKEIASERDVTSRGKRDRRGVRRKMSKFRIRKRGDPINLHCDPKPRMISI